MKFFSPWKGESKVSLVIGAILLLYTCARADCNAPNLAFPKHNGALYGFIVTKLYHSEEVREATRAQHTVIQFGDYHFSLAHESGTCTPRKVAFDARMISRKLLDNFAAGTYYLGSEEQKYSIHSLEAFDLNGDIEADLILFEVRLAANVYSGVVGIFGQQWLTVVEPTCY